MVMISVFWVFHFNGKTGNLSLQLLRRPISLDFRSAVLIYSLAFLLIFMVEPIFEGIFSLFALFCLFAGLLKKVQTVPIQ
jgi:hypothetical protein